MGRLKGNERKIVEYFNKRGFSKGGFLKYNYWFKRMDFLIGDENTLKLISHRHYEYN